MPTSRASTRRARASASSSSNGATSMRCCVTAPIHCTSFCPWSPPSDGCATPSTNVATWTRTTCRRCPLCSKRKWRRAALFPNAAWWSLWARAGAAPRWWVRCSLTRFPSFVYLYEPCRPARGLAARRTVCRPRGPRSFLQPLSQRLFPLLDDWGAFAKGRLIREAHALQGNTQQFPEEWSRAHHAPVQFKREALYTTWQARCVASHMAVKVIRIAAWPELAPLLPLPSVRILHLLARPLAPSSPRACASASFQQALGVE